MNLVAEECARKRHHPEWSNVRLYYIGLHHPMLIAKNRSTTKRTFAGPRTTRKDSLTGTWTWHVFAMTRLRG